MDCRRCVDERAGVRWRTNESRSGYTSGGVYDIMGNIATPPRSARAVPNENVVAWSPALKGKLRAAGCDGYTSKPIDVMTLAAEVRFWLEGATKEQVGRFAWP
jgi:hypothetical protein